MKDFIVPHKSLSNYLLLLTLGTKRYNGGTKLGEEAILWNNGDFLIKKIVHQHRTV
jgi:hypothetical protein